MRDKNSVAFKEFLCHVLIYVSHVDIDYSAEEQERIKRLFDEATYEKVYKEFNDMSDYQAYEKILQSKDDFYSTAEEKQELLDYIKVQLYIDGEYSIMEKEVFHFLEKMM